MQDGATAREQQRRLIEEARAACRGEQIAEPHQPSRSKVDRVEVPFYPDDLLPKMQQSGLERERAVHGGLVEDALGERVLDRGRFQDLAEVEAQVAGLLGEREQAFERGRGVGAGGGGLAVQSSEIRLQRPRAE